MEDFAIAEAPAEIGLDSTPEVETGSAPDTGDSESTEVAETTTEVDGEHPEAPIGKSFRVVDNGRLHPLAKATLEEIGAKNPALSSAIKAALFAEDKYKHALPGGLKEVADLRGKIEQLGGDEGIQKVHNELDLWRDFDSKYTSADPEVLNFLTKNPEAQAAFLKIAPLAFEKFRESHPEGYNAYMSSVFDATIQEGGLPLLIEQLGWIGKDNPEILDVQHRLKAFVSGISQLARKSVAPPKIESKAPDTRGAELDQREQQLTRTEWKRESDSKHFALYNQQWKALIGDRKLSDTQQATIKELYGLKLAAIIKAKPEFNQNLNKYFTGKNKDGFMKLFESTYREAVPAALRKAMDQAGVGKPGPKPGQASVPAAKVSVPAGKPALNGNAGFSQVPAKPNITDVDRIRTTAEMYQKNQAILRNGSRVFWKSKP